MSAITPHHTVNPAMHWSIITILSPVPSTATQHTLLSLCHLTKHSLLPITLHNRDSSAITLTFLPLLPVPTNLSSAALAQLPDNLPTLSYHHHHNQHYLSAIVPLHTIVTPWSICYPFSPTPKPPPSPLPTLRYHHNHSYHSITLPPLSPSSLLPCHHTPISLPSVLSPLARTPTPNPRGGHRLVI